jgi:hypothetical protein
MQQSVPSLPVFTFGRLGGETVESSIPSGLINNNELDDINSNSEGAAALLRRRKGCKLIVNCEHIDEKHYAKVTNQTSNHFRVCATSATTKREGPSWPSDAATNPKFTTRRASARPATFHNMRR